MVTTSRFAAPVLTLCLGAACTEITTYEEVEETTSLIAGSGELSSLRDVDVPPIPEEISIRPANGDLFEGATTGRAIEFAGFAVASNLTIEVQVLSDADLGMADASWVTIAETRTATTPTTFNDPTPIFRWAVTATPVPNSALIARWRPGGVLRYRAVAIDASGRRTSLPFFDAGAGEFVAEVRDRSWKDVLAKCASPFSDDLGSPLPAKATRAAALVSTAPDSGDQPTPPPYLTRKGQISVEDTDAYYRAIDAPPPLEDFRARYGFLAGGETQATFFNGADLGIGRDVHCTTFQERGQPGTACWVGNYGTDENGRPVFGGDPAKALADAIDRRASFASVAMVKIGRAVAPLEGNDVQFFVYDANGALAREAQLDSTGQNTSVPNNCTNCHGGRYDRLRRKLVGAVFLPFDPEAFLFSTRPKFTYEAQEDQLRELNALVREAGAPPPVVQFIDGVYKGSVNRPGVRADLDWAPVGWSRSREAKTLYREVIKPYCRTCHISQVGEFSFMRIEDFKSQARDLVSSVCDKKEMPIAEATLDQLWRSPARAHLLNALGASNACAPERRR